MSIPEVVFSEKPRGYHVNGVKVPGVTTVLGILDKPALPPWAAKMTVLGVARLMMERRLPAVPSNPERLRQKLAAENIKVPENPDREALASGVAHLLKRRLKSRKLDHFSITGDAIDRGNAVHKAQEDWINHRRIPVLANYPETHRGYIQGWTRFVLEWEPEFLEAERPIGSAVHGFAGTRDTVCRVRHAKYGRCLLDLKTSKAVYPGTMFPQLMAYEIGGVECGDEPTDRQGIVRIGDGEFEVAWSVAEPDDFLSVLHAYKRQQALIARAKETRNAE